MTVASRKFSESPDRDTWNLGPVYMGLGYGFQQQHNVDELVYVSRYKYMGLKLPLYLQCQSACAVVV